MLEYMEKKKMLASRMWRLKILCFYFCLWHVGCLYCCRKRYYKIYSQQKLPFNFCPLQRGKQNFSLNLKVQLWPHTTTVWNAIVIKVRKCAREKSEFATWFPQQLTARRRLGYSRVISLLTWQQQCFYCNENLESNSSVC